MLIKWMGLSFQDGISWWMYNLDPLHDHYCFYLIAILTLVGGVMSALFFHSYFVSSVIEFPILEFFWTFCPMLFLGLMGAPSMVTLFNFESMFPPDMTLKVIGHQWFWSYEGSGFGVKPSSLTTVGSGLDSHFAGFGGETFNFDSYMLPVDSLEVGGFRLLEVDNVVCLPFQKDVRCVVTSTDVIHSWAVPSMGIKIDANPGRLNQIIFGSHFPGLFYGQCSEICGANHSFMPISLAFSGDEFFDEGFIFGNFTNSTIDPFDAFSGSGSGDFSGFGNNSVVDINMVLPPVYVPSFLITIFNYTLNYTLASGWTPADWGWSWEDLVAAIWGRPGNG